MQKMQQCRSSLKPTETLERFIATMECVDKEWEQVVGPSWSGCSRACFKLDGHYCYLESCMPSNWLKPSTAYWWTDWSATKAEAQAMAGKFNGGIEQNPYDDDFYHLTFDSFELLCRYLYVQRVAQPQKHGSFLPCASACVRDARVR